MQNFESLQSGEGPKKGFGTRESKRTAGSSHIKNAFNSATDSMSNLWNGAKQNVSDEWKEHAAMARKSRNKIVRFLEGALGTPPEDSAAYEF